MRRCYSPPLPKVLPKSWPRIWLMSDERMGDALLASIAALPRGSGVVFRHYQTPDRKALFGAVKQLAEARRLVLVLAGPERRARRWKADGSHNRSPHRATILRTAPVHSIPERLAAERAGADLLFVSPVFGTRSHVGAKALGRVRFGMLVHGAKCPVIALGGLTRQRARALHTLNIYGWAAINALTV
jgi:thiamine-phosphate pyrophosphorylase